MVNNQTTMRRARPLSLEIPRPPTPPRGQRSRSKSPGQGLVSLSPYKTERGDWEDVSPRVGDIVRKFEGLNKGNAGFKLDFSSPGGCFRNESRSSGIVSDFEEAEEVEVDSEPFKNFQSEIAQSSSSSEGEADAEDKLSQDFLKQNASEIEPNFLDGPSDDAGCWLASDGPEDDVNVDVPENLMTEEDLHFYDQVDADDRDKIEIEGGSSWLTKALKVAAFLYLVSGAGYGLFLLGLETYFGNFEGESDGLKMNLAWGGFLLLKFLVFYKFLGIYSLLRNGTPIVSSHLKQLFLLILQPSLFLISSTSSPEVNLETSEVLFSPKSQAEAEPEDSGFLDDDQDSFVNNNSEDYSEFLSQAEANNGNHNNNHGLSWLSLLSLGVLQLGSVLGPLTFALTQSTPAPNLNLSSDILLRSFFTFGLPVQLLLLIFLRLFFSNKIKTH